MSELADVFQQDIAASIFHAKEAGLPTGQGDESGVSYGPNYLFVMSAIIPFCLCSSGTRRTGHPRQGFDFNIVSECNHAVPLIISTFCSPASTQKVEMSLVPNSSYAGYSLNQQHCFHESGFFPHSVFSPCSCNIPPISPLHPPPPLPPPNTITKPNKYMKALERGDLRPGALVPTDALDGSLFPCTASANAPTFAGAIMPQRSRRPLDRYVGVTDMQVLELEAHRTRMNQVRRRDRSPFELFIGFDGAIGVFLVCVCWEGDLTAVPSRDANTINFRYCKGRRGMKNVIFFR